MTIEGTADKGTLREALDRVNNAFDAVMEAIEERTITREVGDRFLGNIAAVRAALSSKDEPLDVERLARAIYEADNPAHIGGGYDALNPQAHLRRRKYASAVLTALSKETPA